MIKPCSDKVLVEPIHKHRENLIYLPTNRRNYWPGAGRVIAVGPGKRNRRGRLVPPPVVPGQIVAIKKFHGTFIEHEGREYMILTPDQIAGILCQTNENCVSSSISRPKSSATPNISSATL